MRFKTISGTEYVLRNIEMVIEATGEECPSVGPQGIPVAVSYVGELARAGKPLYDLFTNTAFETTEDFARVEFSSLPEIGSRFTYFHPEWFGCYSTEVEFIDEEVG